VHEGGFQNRVKDWANWIGGRDVMNRYLQTMDPSLMVNLVGTNHGITAQDLPKLRALGINTAIKDLSVMEAGVFYKAEFYNTLYDNINDQLLGEKLFDMGVLMGVGTAVRLLQISLAQGLNVVSDGKFGPITLAQMNAHGSLPGYRVVLLNHCMDVINRNPAEAEDLGGWTVRINS
jgi:hypothetical protein